MAAESRADDRRHAALVDGLKGAEATERFAQIGGEATPGTPEQFADYIASETLRWGKLIRDSGIRE